MTRFGKLTLRDLFWLLLLVAVAVGWWLERSEVQQQLARFRAEVPWLSQPNLPNLLSQSWRQRTELLSQLKALSNSELSHRFQNAKPATPYGATDEYHVCLIDMARRGLHSELQVQYDKLMKSEPWPPHEDVANLYLLTALRRAQGKPDPLEIEVELNSTQAEVHGNTGFVIPAVQVKLKNVDQELIRVTRGGDYRSGRQTRWRVQLTDHRGERVADSNFPLFGPGGGISSFGVLKPGEVYENHGLLDARWYLKSPQSRRYQLQVFYGETEIALEEKLDGLVVWKSKPIEVLVENHNRTLGQRISAKPLIAILGVGGMVLWGLQIRRRKQAAMRGETLPPIVSWRDLVALLLLVGLIIGWIIDTGNLYAAIDSARPDTKAMWTMMPAVGD